MGFPWSRQEEEAGSIKKAHLQIKPATSAKAPQTGGRSSVQKPWVEHWPCSKRFVL